MATDSVTTQVGGRLLGQGVYGCTFDPAPRCADGRSIQQIGDLHAVGKVTADDSDDELSIGKKVMALPLAAQYFALPTIGCEPAMPIDDPDVKQCKVIMKPRKHDRFSMLIMPGGGQSLKQYAYDHVRMTDHFKQIFIHILEGAAIYQNAGYIHNDIHPGNILVDHSNVARFIDFGLAFNLNDIRTWKDTNLGLRFRPKYLYQAPEIHAFRAKLNGISANVVARELYDYHSEYKRMETYYFTSRPTAITSISRIMNHEHYMDSMAFIQKYGKKIDAWRIGLCMWMIWDDLMYWIPFRQTGLYAEKRLILQVLGGLTDFHPRTRISIEDALALLTAKA